MINMVNMTNMEGGKQMVNESRTTRFVVMLTAGEHDAIQNYRFARRLGTKAEAVRQLVVKGLEAETKTATEQGCNPR